jgi:hypothetical protein
MDENPERVGVCQVKGWIPRAKMVLPGEAIAARSIRMCGSYGGSMDEMTNILNKLVPRESLYCVWIREREGESAPLIRLWIDPAMTALEAGARVQEPDVAAPPSETEAALANEGTS